MNNTTVLQGYMPAGFLLIRLLMKKIKILTAIFSLMVLVAYGCGVDSEPQGYSLKSIHTDKELLILEVGGKEQLNAVAVPAVANQPAFQWSSTNESVATVNNGLVKAIAPGKTDITVTASDVSAKVEVEVTEAGQHGYKYHFQPKKGFMNDPNGLSQFKGVYHLFFQYCPGIATRNKWWGHATSTDLIHWEELAPIESGTPADDWGMWSGSAIQKDGKMYLFYTGLRSSGEGSPRGVPGHGMFGQCLMTSSDGKTFEKHPNNPLIETYPDNDGDAGFRDPSILKYGNEYFMVCASRNALLYKSSDLIRWNYVGTLLESGGIECPDFRPFGDKYLLITSLGNVSGVPEAIKFCYGDFDGKKFKPILAAGPEKGPHFYAPQSFIDEKGRHILIGWMFDINAALAPNQTGGRTQKPNPDTDGALSIPREIKIENGKILCYPVEEMQHLLKDWNEKDFPDVSVTKTKVALNVPFPTPLEFKSDHINEVKILRDANCLEVFINKGEAVFTYLY